METRIEKKENETVITVSGRLDTVNANDFQKQLDRMADADLVHVVIDCAALEYISSSGLRAFISLLKRAQKAGGDVKVLHLNSNVKEVFDMTGFSALFGL